jgi:hypothetical protein
VSNYEIEKLGTHYMRDILINEFSNRQELSTKDPIIVNIINRAFDLASRMEMNNMSKVRRNPHIPVIELVAPSSIKAQTGTGIPIHNPFPPDMAVFLKKHDDWQDQDADVQPEKGGEK